MTFRGRTVLALIILAMFAGSVLTLTVGNSFIGSKIFATQGDIASPDSGLSQKDLRKIETTYRLIQDKSLIKIDEEQVINGAITGMLGALDDPFTVYMDQKEAQQFADTISSSFQGIGAEVSLEEGKVTVVSPIKGSPAEKAGIKPKDVLLSVNGDTLNGLTLNQAVMKIRGPKGTQAKLEIVRTGNPKPILITVVRDNINLETVYGEMLEHHIGKIDIIQFSENTANRFKEELQLLESQGMKALVIDVRNDPGGLLPVVQSIVEPFVPKGKAIYQLEDRNGHREPALSSGAGKDYPVAVLINGGSASASEILAGALKESAGSLLIGEKTYGKGTVQITFEKELGDGSNIKLTVLKWLTPDGNWIHKEGIEPDLVVAQPDYFRVAPLSKTTVLKQNMNSEDVKNMQIMLKGLGLNPGRVDGYFDAATTLAVHAFQRLHKLAETGEVDKTDAEQLELAIIDEMKDPQNDLQLQAAVKELLERTAQ